MRTDAPVLHRVAGFAACLVGGVLVIAGFGKTLDLTLFAREIESILLSFGFDGSRALVIFAGVGAVAVVLLELLSGAMLIGDWRRQIGAVVSMTMMVFFTGVILWGSYSGVIDECGCFGALASRSPALAIVEDVVLLALAWLAYFSPSGKSRTGKAVVAGVIAAGIAGMLAFSLLPTRWGVLKVGDDFPGGIASPELEFPPMSLLWNLNPECPECVGKTQVLNYIDESTPVQAVSDASDGRIREYQWDFQPAFPVSKVQAEEFKSLGLQSGCALLLRGKTVSQIYRIFELDSALAEFFFQIKSN